MPVFAIGEVTAVRDFRIAQCRPIGRASVERDIGQRLRPQRDGRVAVGAHPKILQQSGMCLQVFELLGAQLRISLLHLQKFLRIEIAQERDLHDAKPIRSHIGHGVRDIHIHAVNHRHHRDQRGGGQNNSQQRQEAPQLARTQRIRRNRSSFAK